MTRSQCTDIVTGWFWPPADPMQATMNNARAADVFLPRLRSIAPWSTNDFECLSVASQINQFPIGIIPLSKEFPSRLPKNLSLLPLKSDRDVDRQRRRE
jgi:hypothetical protein